MAETRRKFDAEFRAGAVPAQSLEASPPSPRPPNGGGHLSRNCATFNLFGDVDGLVGG
jgi:hypothetical protein